MTRSTNNLIMGATLVICIAAFTTGVLWGAGEALYNNWEQVAARVREVPVWGWLIIGSVSVFSMALIICVPLDQKLRREGL